MRTTAKIVSWPLRERRGGSVDGRTGTLGDPETGSFLPDARRNPAISLREYSWFRSRLNLGGSGGTKGGGEVECSGGVQAFWNAGCPRGSSAAPRSSPAGLPSIVPNFLESRCWKRARGRRRNPQKSPGAEALRAEGRAPLGISGYSAISPATSPAVSISPRWW